LGDAKEIVTIIDQLLENKNIHQEQHTNRAKQLKASAIEQRDEKYQTFFDAIHQIVPDAIIVGDSTQPTYFAQAFYECEKPRRYFHSATGFGTLGYAFPATLGAKLAQPNLPVIGLIGDGGGQFTINELASAVEINADVTFIVWNNSGFGEIKRFMKEQEIPTIGVDIYTPNYANIAREYGLQSWHVESISDFSESLAMAIAHRGPCLIEINEFGIVSTYPF
jgi:acetolactate synthase-1/2/3 large subunit